MKACECVVVLAFALSSAHALAADRPIGGIGPFALGMSLEDARAAAPDLAWHATETSAYSDRVLAIGADDALMLGGYAHFVEIKPGYYGKYEIRLEHRFQSSGAKQCELQTLPIVADLESRYGRFTSQPNYSVTPGARSMPTWSTQRLPNGSVIVTPMPGSGGPIRIAEPHDKVKAGKRSYLIFTPPMKAAKERAGDDDFKRVGRTEIARNKTELRIESRYEPELFGAPVCTVVITFLRHGSPPLSRKMEVSPDTFNRLVTIGTRHHSLDDVTSLSDDTSIRFECTREPASRIARGNRELVCNPVGNRLNDADPMLVAAAQARISEVNPNDDSFDPDNSVPLTIQLDVRLSPADRHGLDFTAVSRTPTQDIDWIGVPSMHEMRRYGSNLVGTVSVLCQIQQDLSNICVALDVGGAVVPPDVATAAQRSAVEIVRQFKAAETLKTGTPASQVVFATVVDFNRGP